MAAIFAALIGAALLEEAMVIAWVLEGLLAAGVMAAVFGDFCGAAQLYITFRRPIQRRTSPRSASS
jgi:hypothetical protein